MKNLYIFLTAFVLIVFSSCKNKSSVFPPASQNVVDITGKKWRLTEINGQPIQLKNPKSNPHFSLN